MVPFGLKYFKSTDMTHNQISAIHVTIFYSDKTHLHKNNTDQKQQIKQMIIEELTSQAIDKLGVITEGQIFINERVLSVDDENVKLRNGRLQIDEDNLLEFIDKNGIIEQHIPEDY